MAIAYPPGEKDAGPDASPRETAAASGPGILTGVLNGPAAHKVRELVGGILGGDNDNHKARRTALLAFGVRVISAAILYLSQILLARWLGTFEYGIFAFTWAVVLIVAGMASLGFSLSVARFIPEYLARNEDSLLRGLLLSSRTIPVLVSTLCALSGAALVLGLDGVVEDYYVVPLILAFICFPVYTLIDIQDGIARANNWINLALIPPYILRPLLVLVFMVVAVLSGAPANAEMALYCSIGAIWLTAMTQWLFLRGRLKKLVTPGERTFRTGFWVKVSMPIFLVDSFFLFMTNTDILVLSHYGSPEDVGIYFAAVKTLALISFVSFAVAAASAHKFSEYYAKGEHTKLEAFVRDSIVWTFWPSLAGTILIVALGKPALWLFGEGFQAAYPVMFIVAFGLLCRAAVGPLERLLNVTGKQNLCAAVYFIAFIMNLSFNLLLIPVYGIIGAAIATSMAYVVESILLAIVVQRKLGLRVMIWHRRPAQGGT